MIAPSTPLPSVLASSDESDCRFQSLSVRSVILVIFPADYNYFDAAFYSEDEDMVATTISGNLMEMREPKRIVMSSQDVLNLFQFMGK